MSEQVLDSLWSSVQYRCVEGQPEKCLQVIHDGVIRLLTSQFSDLTEIQKQYDHSKVDLSLALSHNRL